MRAAGRFPPLHSVWCRGCRGSLPPRVAQSKVHAAQSDSAVTRLVQRARSAPQFPLDISTELVAEAGQFVVNGKCTPSETTLLIWATAKLGLAPAWLPKALEAVLCAAEDARFEDLALCAWAVSRLPLACRPTVGWWSTFWTVTSSQLDAMTPLTASQLSFALSQGARPPKAWMTSCLKHTEHVLSQCTGGELRQMLSGVSLAEDVPAEWMHAFWAAFSASLQTLSPSECTAIMQSAARMRCTLDARLLDDVETFTEARLAQFTDSELTLFLRAIVKLGRTPDELFLDGIVADARRRLSTMTLESMWLLLSCCAELRHQPSSSWLREFAAAATPLLQSASAKELSRIAWAHAVLSVNPGQEFLLAFDARALEVLHHFNRQGLANTCWALVVLSAYDCAALPRLWARLIEQMQSDAAAKLDWIQLAEVSRFAHQERPGLLAELPAELARRADSLWTAHAGGRNRSANHKFVSYLLKRFLQVPFESNKLCQRTGRNVDLALLPAEDLRIAVLVDGPALFTCNTWQQTGQAKLRDRALALAGWRVVVVPHFALEGVSRTTAGGGANKAVEYLRRRLTDAVAPTLVNDTK